VRKLVTDAATGVQRYEWVFEQRSWARPNRRLESRMETVQPPPADRPKGKAAGLIASMRPVKSEPAEGEQKKVEGIATDRTDTNPATISKALLPSAQLISPSLDDQSVIGPSATPPQS
jgi:hypothetical protein